MWVAHVGVNQTNYTGTYGMWQYSWNGRIPGISQQVDLDKCYVDFPSIINKKTEPTEEPAKRTVMYIPGITAADVQTYLAWTAALGAGEYKDNEQDFKRFLEV